MKIIKIRDIGRTITGATPSTKEPENYNSKDIMFIGPSDIKNNRYICKTEKYISLFAFNNLPTRQLSKNSLVIDCIGSDMGNVAITTASCITNQQINAIIDINFKNVLYFYYLFSTKKSYFHQIGMNGSTMPIISKSLFDDIEILIHDDEEQQHIVNILGTIDDKIENNENLISKINESTKLFYINFCDNGFIDDILENYIKNYDRQRKPLSSRERDALEKNYPYYGATEVLDYVDRYLFDGDYLLMGEDGTVADSLGFPIVQRVNEKFWANNHTHILKAKNGIDNNVLELILKNTNVQSIITGAVQPKINQANMNSLKIKIPNNVNMLQQIIAPYFEKRQSLIVQNKKLNELKQLYLKKFFG